MRVSLGRRLHAASNAIELHDLDFSCPHVGIVHRIFLVLYDGAVQKAEAEPSLRKNLCGFRKSYARSVMQMFEPEKVLWDEVAPSSVIRPA